MAVRKKAETAKELREKYRRKKLTPSTAAQYYVYNYLYWMYCANEEIKVDLSKDRVLDDETPVYDMLGKDHAEGGKAYRLYGIYCDLCEWINSAFENAVLMRNALLDYCVLLYRELRVAYDGEQLRRILGDQAVNDTIAPILKELMIPGSSESEFFLKERIDRNLRYLNAYGTLIEIIAKQTKIPELTTFKVDMTNVSYWINDVLNEMLPVCKKEIGKGTALPNIDEGEIDRAFEEISLTPPPVPQENQARAEAYVRSILSATSNGTWSRAFQTISENYWGRS